MGSDILQWHANNPIRKLNKDKTELASSIMPSAKNSKYNVQIPGRASARLRPAPHTQYSL